MSAEHISSRCHRQRHRGPGHLTGRAAALPSPQRSRLARTPPAGTLRQSPRLRRDDPPPARGCRCLERHKPGELETACVVCPDPDQCTNIPENVKHRSEENF